MSRKIRIVLGVTGSIAATKSQSIALALKASGFEVRAALSYSAQKVIGKSALSSVLPDAPYIDMWESPSSSGGETHIEWGKWADAILIAPATASTISALWSGSYNNTATLIAGTLNPVKWFLAPAMATQMWQQPAVSRNIRELEGWGANMLGPIRGQVASGDIGYRLMEPREIATTMKKALFTK